MKIPKALISALVSFLLIAQHEVSAQTTEKTPGEVTFTFRTVTDNGNYSPKHVLAVWVEDAGGFVKSRLVRANQRKQYLYKWNAASQGNETDATTGATLSSHQTHTVSWDCTDLTGTEVPDGEYTIYIEYTDKHAQGPWTTVTFIKGPEQQHITPADLDYYKDMQLDFMPQVDGIEDQLMSGLLDIFPNPGNGIFFIQNKFELDITCTVYNNSGQLVTTRNFISTANQKNLILDLSHLPDGIYIINISDETNHFTQKVIKQN